MTDHSESLKNIFTLLGRSEELKSLNAIGHRVVHGGEIFQTATLIDEDVIKKIRELIPLAPLHNPANLAGIETARHYYPHLPQVASFDTAFFNTLPPHACRYALPDYLYQQHRVRRYGFHGTSHQYVARAAADFLEKPLESLRLITLHLGNGASAAAIRDGICIDTSMGMTPLEGLVMGSRCGDVDPSLHFYLARTMGMDLDEIERLLNHDSGLKGLCGEKDMRTIHQLADGGDESAGLAIELFCYRIAKYVGAYYAILDGLDAIVFTAGIGENDPVIRQRVCERISALGTTLDHTRNQSCAGPVSVISGKDSKVKVLVVTTNEELEIARQAVSVINQTGTQ